MKIGEIWYRKDYGDSVIITDIKFGVFERNPSKPDYIIWYEYLNGECWNNMRKEFLEIFEKIRRKYNKKKVI